MRQPGVGINWGGQPAPHTDPQAWAMGRLPCARGQALRQGPRTHPAREHHGPPCPVLKAMVIGRPFRRCRPCPWTVDPAYPLAH